MKNVMTNNKGFSLVELMVVVAIIGILAAMSVGQVQKQIAKSRQAEAKTNISTLYTANKSLYAEYSAYSTNFNILGTGFEGNLRYNTGFLNSVGAPSGWTGAAADGIFITGIDTTPAATEYCQGPGTACTTIQSNATDPGALAANGILVNSTSTTFAAGAAAFIFNTALQDTWAINENKTIANVVVGIP